MVNSEFFLLCSKAWSIQILAYMHAQNDPRISPIAHHFSAGRTSIVGALSHLIEMGYLRKNSGHGHPLRPAYVLTPKGKAIAEWAAELDGFLEPNDWKIARRSWALPIIRAVAPARRFGELRSILNPVTDRALSETLKTLGENQWVNRHIDGDSSPPSVTYLPLGTGQLIVSILNESLNV